MPKRWPFMVGLPLAMACAGPALAQDGAQLLEQSCGGCHQPVEGGLERIKDQRKTPEGWDMTIVRMMQLHGVDLADDDRRALVKHLADTQGLAPSEAAGWRYILEREPAVFEQPPSDELATMCARCHSYARVALQRRTEEEWRKLAHFHLGQYPTTEYQALGRDRNWWEIASEELPPELAELYPLESQAWQDWQAQDKPDLAGEWRFVGFGPVSGHFEGESTVTAEGDDRYTVQAEARYANGETVEGRGSGIVYTGYEWRGSMPVGERTIREVYEAAPDGRSASGRWFYADSDSIGGPVVLVRSDGPPQVLSVVPPYLKAGESAELAIHGIGLGEQVDLGEGVTVDEVVSASPKTVVVRASAAGEAQNGLRDVTAGEASGDGLLTVYDQIAEVTVEPPYNIARVGGGGGPIPPVPAAFTAVGWAEGPDDMVRVGPMPATFAIENIDEVAESMDDASFAGTMAPESGLFQPAEAGLNPERPFETNNAGNLKVVATVEDSGETITGEGQLLVTVQRWNDPPIR